ncbi:hypothetical protein GCK72_025821 [Caenorhabditis remanei]|uniref:Uncharacterized protein n=1 Tax=Caenorhabditis remanei TaxID=31234 RepID=A0A6A5G428_CAERE|nr:hypothetical protein GCK72_025821 [Caenorhabditis remanei]KAF1749354.1 hypothetical protein GCK72_025821 [Caenorhabditis remanei]
MQKEIIDERITLHVAIFQVTNREISFLEIHCLLGDQADFLQSLNHMEAVISEPSDEWLLAGDPGKWGDLVGGDGDFVGEVIDFLNLSNTDIAEGVEVNLNKKKE